MEDKYLCFYSIIRYVADPIRDEPRNVGVLVVSPDGGFGGARFRLAGIGVRAGSHTYEMLRSVAHHYSIEMPGYRAGDLFAELPSSWTRADLDRLHQECTNLLQFTEPAPALAEPQEFLDEMYRERVLPKTSRPRSTSTRTAVVRTLKRALKPKGKADWVQEDARVPVDGEEFQFDIAVSNGRLYYAIETLSFRSRDLQRVEHDAAWFAYVWPKVECKTQAKGLLVVDAPQLDREETASYPQEEYRKVTQWAERAGIQVHKPEELDPIAAEIARAVSPPALV